MSNEPTWLASKKQKGEYCTSHFDCDRVTIRGGRRPSQPCSIFPGVSKSCLKEVHESQRTTQNSTVEVRQQKQQQTLSN